MSDPIPSELVERLRRGPVWSNGEPIGSAVGEINGATMNEAADLIERLTSAAAEYVLAPVEPTAEMLRSVDHMDGDKFVARGLAIEVWQSMLSTAPSPSPVARVPDREELVRREITAEMVQRLVDYNPDTGELIWKRRDQTWFMDSKFPDRTMGMWNAKNAGKPAFDRRGRSALHGKLFRISFTAHRIAWAAYYGCWPEYVIDHINGDPFDNRISNLRDVPQAENMKNTALSRANTSGAVGVSFSRGKWEARITVDGRPKFLGYFDTFDDALAERKAGEREAGFHPNHGRALFTASPSDGSGEGK